MPVYQIALLVVFGIATLWWGYRLDKKNRQKELAAKRQSETRASQGRWQTSLIYVCAALKAAWSAMTLKERTVFIGTTTDLPQSPGR